MPENAINVHAGQGLVHAPQDSVGKLKQQMTNEAFRKSLASDPQHALNSVGINVDSHTATAIKNQLAGAHGLSPNAIITVTAIA
jgi:hypothetical protein